MAIRLLSTLFDFVPNTIVRDLAYDIERRLVARGAATYDLSGGTEATVPTLNPNLSDVERRILLLEELLLTNRNTSTLEPFAVSDWVLHGIYDYNDDATSTTPLAITAAGGLTDIPFIKQQYKTAGAQNLNRFNGIYMGDANTLNYPAKFQIQSDDNADVLVRGWYLTVTPRFAKFQL